MKSFINKFFMLFFLMLGASAFVLPAAELQSARIVLQVTPCIGGECVGFADIVIDVKRGKISGKLDTIKFRPEYQGLGLGKIFLIEALKVMINDFNAATVGWKAKPLGENPMALEKLVEWYKKATRQTCIEKRKRSDTAKSVEITLNVEKFTQALAEELKKASVLDAPLFVRAMNAAEYKIEVLLDSRMYAESDSFHYIIGTKKIRDLERVKSLIDELTQPIRF